MTIESRIPNSEDDALQVLLDADIDRVMAGLDRIVEAAPSYEKLFSRWENQPWSSEQFDFSQDAEQWDDATRSAAEQKEFIQWRMSSFFLGEERVTTELLPFAIAAPVARGARLPGHADLRRGQAHGLLRPLLPRGVRRRRRDAVARTWRPQRPRMNDE